MTVETSSTQPAGAEPSAPDSTQAAADFVRWMRDAAVPTGTLNMRAAQVRRFVREVDVPLANLDADIITGYLIRPEWSATTRKNHRSALATFFAWAVDHGRLHDDPMRDVPSATNLALEPSLAAMPGASHVLEPLTAFGMHPARVWAAMNGLPCAPTGRVPTAVLRAWEAAGSPTPGLAPGIVETTWNPLLSGFAKELMAAGRRPGTIHLRMVQLRAFSCYAGVPPQEVTRDLVVAYLANRDWAPETRRATRSSLVTFFRWAHDASELETNPAERISSVPVPGGVPNPAPEAAIRDAINGARIDVRLMIMLGALAGLRRGEIARLHTSAITDEGLRVIGKGGKARMVPLHPILAAEIDAYRTRTGLEAGYLFTNASTGQPLSVGHVGELISRRLPPGVTPHKLRHRFASKSYAGQYNLRAVQALLGHASPAVTARYVATPEAALVEAVLAIPPIPGVEAMTVRPRSLPVDHQ